MENPSNLNLPKVNRAELERQRRITQMTFDIMQAFKEGSDYLEFMEALASAQFKVAQELHRVMKDE